MIRKMSRPELDIVIDWAASEGWNPGINDAECFYSSDPDGFFIATDENGKHLGAVSAVAYGNDFGVIGLYIVKPEFRGHVVGPLLGHAAMEHLSGRNIGLDGVEKKVRNYEARGFKLAYHNIRYEGIKNFSSVRRPELRRFNGDIDELLKFDRRFFPAERSVFLRKWVNMPGSEFLCVHDGSEMKAYGVIRKCIQGFKIGPLFSDRPEYAEDILLGLLSSIPEKSKFYLDIPEMNKDALRMVMRYNMKQVFSTARMYSRDFPVIEVGKIYGITSFELG